MSKRAKSGIGFWVTCIAAVLFAIAIGASFPWGYVIVAVAAAVVAQMGNHLFVDHAQYLPLVWHAFEVEGSEILEAES